jgi:HYR domain/Subtilase family
LTVPDPGGAPISLYWSDPLGASSNDYDLFRLNAAGTLVLGSSTNIQNGTQDPYEQVTQNAASPRLVIVKKGTAAPRFLHLNANHGQLSIRTAGSTHGHAAVTGVAAYGVAATPAVGPFPQAFNSGNHVESTSSDGPRQIFYHGDGTAITPGNVSSTGGQVLQKPDFTAADGVSVSGVGGFTTPFFGTSAAAAHAAAIAALVKSANTALTPAEIRTLLTSTAIDIEAPGVDRNSGAGIIMARSAVQATGATGTAFLQIENVQVSENPGNSNGAIESGEGGLLTMTLTNYGVGPATGIAVSLTSPTAGVTVGRANTATYPDLAPTASASNSLSRFTMASDYPCGQPAAFLFTVTYDGGPTVPPLPFVIPIASPPFNVTTTLDETPPPSPPGVVRGGSTGLQAVRLFRDVIGSSCGTPKTFPGTFGVGTRHFDAFDFNTCAHSGPSCVTVTLQGAAAANLLAAGYAPTFDPNNLKTNYAGDPGGSSELTTFSFNVAGAGQHFAINVAEVNSDGGLGTLYDLTVSGACYGSCDPPNRLPVATAKNVIAAATDLCVADASIDDESADPDGDTITVVQAPPPPYTLGTTSVLLTATDPKGAFSEAIGEVTVLDRTPPSIACPAPVTTFTDPGVCSAVVAFGSPAASDLCSNPTAVSSDIASGSSFPLGTTTVKGKATDAAGNEAVCTTLVTVVDNQAPTINGLSVSGTRQSSGRNKLIDFTVDYTATDLCGPAATSLSVTFTNPESRGGLDDHDWNHWDGEEKRGGPSAADDDDDDGDDTPDFVIVDNHHVRLRVDNSGPEGRIYTITVTAVDAAGNRSSSSITVRPTNENH